MWFAEEQCVSRNYDSAALCRLVGHTLGDPLGSKCFEPPSPSSVSTKNTGHLPNSNLVSLIFLDSLGKSKSDFYHVLTVSVSKTCRSLRFRI